MVKFYIVSDNIHVHAHELASWIQYPHNILEVNISGKHFYIILSLSSMVYIFICCHKINVMLSNQTAVLLVIYTK